jgi:hypothetical protein
MGFTGQKRLHKPAIEAARRAGVVRKKRKRNILNDVS